MQGIHRWLSSGNTDTIEIVVPKDCTKAEAVVFTEQGVQLMDMVRPDDGSAITSPEVQVWDDPARTRALMRSETGWQDEDTYDLLKQWEETRLMQFRHHLLNHYHTMQVVYRVPPYTEETHFTREGFTYHGWRIEMIAAIFAGFKPEGLTSFKLRPNILTDTGPGDLHLV